MIELSPILLFVYNRPDHVKRGIASLLKNPEATDSELFVYSDAAKFPKDEEQVNKVRKIIHEVAGFHQLHIIERTENWGLARNIIDGVTNIISQYGRVIVLEDDLIVAPYFLRFMNEALETYKNEEKVGHIQACDFTQDKTLPDTFLIKLAGSWGWATWERAWKYFNPNGSELLQKLEDKQLTKVFDFNGKYKFTRMLRRQIEGKNNSWAIRWNASLFLENILSLNVGHSLVHNEGFDGSGTNCGAGDLYASDLYMQPLEVKKISPIEENEAARKAFERYYARTNSFTAKAIRRIRRTLKGDFGA